MNIKSYIYKKTKEKKNVQECKTVERVDQKHEKGADYEEISALKLNQNQSYLLINRGKISNKSM